MISFMQKDELREFFHHHIQGEFDMFKWAYSRLVNEGEAYSSGYERRAVHECFLLHVRNLADFLWKKKKNDDAVAVDYSVEPDCPNDNEFKNIFGDPFGCGGRINKQLSHITFSRMKNQDLFEKNSEIYEYIMSGIRSYNEKALQDFVFKLGEEG